MSEDSHVLEEYFPKQWKRLNIVVVLDNINGSDI